MLKYPLRSAGMDERKLLQNDIEVSYLNAIMKYGPNFNERKFWEHHRDLYQKQTPPYDDWFDYFPKIKNTTFAWILQSIIRDLYDFDKPLNKDTFEEFKEIFKEKTTTLDWAKKICEKNKIEKILSSRYFVPLLKENEWDGNILFTVEEAPFEGTIREYMPWAHRIRYLEKKLKIKLKSFKALKEVSKMFFSRYDWSDKHAFVLWVSSIADFSPVPEKVYDELLKKARKGSMLDLNSIKLLNAAFIKAYCGAIRDKVKVFQLVYGIQFVVPGYKHLIQRAASEFASTLGYLLNEFPDIHFNILNGYEPDEPILCSLCLGYNNISLGGFWWNNFYPSVMYNNWLRRLDVVPFTRLMGFFSDGYCIDWVYGRLKVTKMILANVFATKINQGFYTLDDAVNFAKHIFYYTPQEIFIKK